jgi:hypothetical protein
MAPLIDHDQGPDQQAPWIMTARSDHADTPEYAAPATPAARLHHRHTPGQHAPGATPGDRAPEQQASRSTLLPALPAASGEPPGPGLVLTLETSGGEPDLPVVDYVAQYAMALSHCLVEAGSPPVRLELRAGQASPGEDGQPVRVALRVSGQAGTLDQPSFEALARIAALGCRVNSAAARGLDVQLEARLAQPSPAAPPAVTSDPLLVGVLRDELTFLRSELANRTAEVLHKDQLIARLAERLPLPPAAPPPTRPWWAFWRH